VYSDIEIAQQATLKPVNDIAKRLGIPPEALDPYGHYKAKISLEYINSLISRPDGKLILVTAMSPTPAGEGKTTTTVGLGDALNRIGKKAVICLREPSLGPVFGMKGGAAGGGYAQVVPMEDINLHFTGDFGAIALANNLLAALLDNHIHHGNELDIDVRRIAWKRVVDMNDRALREIVCSLGGPGNGYPRQDGFDIVVASEVMAILCLATSLANLKERLGNIVVGYTRAQKPVTARDLHAHGAMTVLLREALKPNLVQTLENNPAFIHGGPFANIAHGCNSVLATRTALKLADYVVTEAGFGADLGAEKFIDIKCRKSGLRPAAVVIVATLRALKFHGGCELKDVNNRNLEALDKGIANLERHVANVQNHYGLPCVVSTNQFTSDTPEEFALLEKRFAGMKVPVISARHWADGGKGAEAVAHAVVKIVERGKEQLSTTCTRMRCRCGTRCAPWRPGSTAPRRSRLTPRCVRRSRGCRPMAMVTSRSASRRPSIRSRPTLRAKGAPSGHSVNVREVRLAAGAEFIVMVCGDIMTMPGLPKVPSANRIDIDDNGKISGLF
jgi:formate--tetrahydrofolate ligase